MSISLNLEQVRENQEQPCHANLTVIASEQGFFDIKKGYLDISTLDGVFHKNCLGYSQHRRFIKSINRLNFLQYDFDFGRSTFLTLTISDDYIDNNEAIILALNRLQRLLKRKGIFYYVIVKELGSLTNRLHYHLILFNAPYLKIKVLRKVWRVGNIKIQEAYNLKGGVYYLTCYIKKGLRLSWSRRFFKDKILRNDVYYTSHYDKKTGAIVPDKVFGVYITKSDYKIFKNRIPSALLARLSLKNFKKEVKKDVS